MCPKGALCQPIDLANTCTTQQWYFAFVYCAMCVICEPLCPKGTLCQHIDLAMINALLGTDDYAHNVLEDTPIPPGGGKVWNATGGPVMIAGDLKWLWYNVNRTGGVADPPECVMSLRKGLFSGLRHRQD